MSRPALLVLLSTLALLALGAACGGGDDSDRVQIHRLDLAGVELTIADYFAPPFVDQYPEVVAEVNGEPITGEALAARQVMLELNRRQTADSDFDLLGGQLLAYIESIDPLEALIDEELEKQAVERLGLLPPYEEAAAITREQQEAYEKALEAASPEEREESQELRRLLDLPEGDWASDPDLVASYRWGRGVAALRSRVCDPVPTPTALLTASTRRDCSKFLKDERESANIRYLVKWVD